MLSEPKAGWTEFDIEGHIYGLSYLTDIPVDWLTSAAFGLKNFTPFVVCGMEEPGIVLCLVDYFNCITMQKKETNSKEPLSRDDISDVTVTKVSMLEFCKNLYDDVSNYLEGWISWDYAIEKGTQEYDKRKKKLTELLIQLKIAIEDEKTVMSFDPQSNTTYFMT